MTRIIYILRGLGRNIRRNPGAAIGSFLSLLLLFVLFDLFWIAALSSNAFYDDVLAQVQVEVFLNEQTPDTTAQRYGNEILMMPEVRKAQFIGRSEARKELATLVGTDLLIGYDTLNPLPRSIRIECEPEALTSAHLKQLTDRIRQLTGATDIYYSRTWLEKAEQTRRIVRTAGLVLGAVILLTALVTTANSLRLMTQVRAGGFMQMLLLGAGKAFIALPFVLEGFLISGLAAAVGWAGLFYGRQRVEFTQMPIVLPKVDDILLFCLAAGLLGAISGLLGTRRLWRS